MVGDLQVVAVLSQDGREVAVWIVERVCPAIGNFLWLDCMSNNERSGLASGTSAPHDNNLRTLDCRRCCTPIRSEARGASGELVLSKIMQKQQVQDDVLDRHYRVERWNQRQSRRPNHITAQPGKEGQQPPEKQTPEKEH